MAEFGLTATGVSIPRLIDYLDAFDASYLADTGVDLDSSNTENSDLVLVRLVGYLAALLDELGQQAQALADIIDPDAASGVQLTNLARIVGVTRKRATKSTVTLRCSGTDGTALPLGQIASGTSRWVSTEDATIGASGFVDVAFEAETAGEVTGLAGTITQIVTPVDGWTSVTNATDAAVGVAEETDGALRGRMRDEIASRAGSGVRGIRSRILALDFITSCVILANGDSDPATVKGVSLSGNSVLVVVLPTNLSTSQQQQVLGILYDSSIGTVKHEGTDVDGEVVNLEDGTSWPVSFDYGADLAITVDFTGTAVQGASAKDVRDALKAAIDALFPFKLGQELTQLKLCAEAEKTQLVKSTTVLIQGVGDDFQPLVTQRILSATVSWNGVVAT